MKLRFIAIALSAVALTASAYAAPANAMCTPVVGGPAVCSLVEGVISDVGDIGETNILFNSKFLPNGPADLISGFDKKIHTQVDFSTTSASPLLFSSGGQSDIDPSPDTEVIHNLTITVPGGVFDDFILNPGKNKSAEGTDGDLFATVTLSNGDTAKLGPWGVKDEGNNFLTICMTGSGKDGCVPASDTGEGTQPDIMKIVVTSDSGFADLKQPRISGIEGGIVTPVPEPSSMMLVGSGLLVFTQVLRRKLKLNKNTCASFRHQ